MRSLGLLIGLIGFPLAYYFYRKTVRTKLLAYAYTKPVSLRLPIRGVPSDYLVDPEPEPSRVFVLLWNRGTAPIEKSDFVTPIKILPTERVLRILTHEQDGTAAATMDEAEKSISIDLLRPGEAIIFLIDAIDPDYSPEISVVMKSSDMSAFLRSAPIENRDIAGLAVGIVTLLVLAATIIWSLSVFELAPPRGVLLPATIFLNFAYSVTAAFLFAAYLSYLSSKWTRRSLWRFTPFLPFKFFELQGTCADINASWSRLRQQSDRLMAAG